MKKIDQAKKFLTEQMTLFQCPVCKEPFEKLQEHSLICRNGHVFDLSKKGTLYFLKKASKNEYDKNMLSARFAIAQAGLFDPLIEMVYKNITRKEDGTVLDVGSGEGSHLDKLVHLGLKGNLVGFDISKDAIILAASHFTSAFWCVADLAQSPFAANQFDTILNIFSPSNYQEFERLLKEDGQVIKVVPDADYLIELRKLFYLDQQEKQRYSNEHVIQKFQEHFSETTIVPIRYTFPLDSELFDQLMLMTPLGWGATAEGKQYAMQHPLQSVTVHVQMLIGKKGS